MDLRLEHEPHPNPNVVSFRILARTHVGFDHLSRKVLEGNSELLSGTGSPPGLISFEEVPAIELTAADSLHLDFNDRSEMNNNPSRNNNSHGFGSSLNSSRNNPDGESSSKYSHEETRPEKMQERIQGLNHDMQDSLQRLHNLEVKLKNGAVKRRKRTNQTNMRNNVEFQKVLSDIMGETHVNPPK